MILGIRGVIEAKSEGRKILLTDFDYANGAHNAMTNITEELRHERMIRPSFANEVVR